jgi:hypothetical protein
MTERRAGTTQQKHVCELLVMPEGEAFCPDCGAYYIFHSTLDQEGRDEMLSEARELGLVV